MGDFAVIEFPTVEVDGCQTWHNFVYSLRDASRRPTRASAAFVGARLLTVFAEFERPNGSGRVWMNRPGNAGELATQVQPVWLGC